MNRSRRLPGEQEKANKMEKASMKEKRIMQEKEKGRKKEKEKRNKKEKERRNTKDKDIIRIWSKMMLSVPSLDSKEMGKLDLSQVNAETNPDIQICNEH